MGTTQNKIRALNFWQWEMEKQNRRKIDSNKSERWIFIFLNEFLRQRAKESTEKGKKKVENKEESKVQ